MTNRRKLSQWEEWLAAKAELEKQRLALAATAEAELRLRTALQNQLGLGPRMLRATTRRQEQIAKILLEHPAWSNKEVANLVGITPRTVKCHMKGLFEAFGVTDRRELLERLREGK